MKHDGKNKCIEYWKNRWHLIVGIFLIPSSKESYCDPNILCEFLSLPLPHPSSDRYTFNFVLSENPEKFTVVFAQDFSVEN